MNVQLDHHYQISGFTALPICRSKKSSNVALWSAEPDKVRILKDNEIVYSKLMTTQMVVDVEYKSNEEEQDSEKSVDYPSDDYNTEWNKFQNIVTDTKFRAFCQKFTERG